MGGRLGLLVCDGFEVLLLDSRLEALGESNWLETGALHKGAKLRWHLFEDLLGEVTPGACLVELNELHDVARTGLAARVLQHAIITIELFHGVEVSLTDSNDDDRDGMVTQLTDQVLRLWHVVDGSIGEQKEHIVRHLSLLRANQVQKLLQKRCEKSGSTQADLLLHLLVGSHDVLHGKDVRVGSVTIDSEAVTHSVDAHVAWHSTEAEHWEVLVEVVWFDH